MNLTPADIAALDFGRMWMRAVSAEQEAVLLRQQLVEKEAQLAEFTNGEAKPVGRTRAKT